MLCSRRVVPFLVLHLLLDRTSAAALPSGVRNRRSVDWPDQELFHSQDGRLDWTDMSVGDVDDANWDVDGRPSRSETILATAEQLPVKHQNKNQHHRKANEKRRKVPPLDPIGGFLLSRF